MSQYITKNCTLPPYMAFPRFLLENQNLNETAKILYTILLDRTKLSLSHMDWVDEIGRVFIYFPIKSLCEVMHKSDMSIKSALSALEKEDLIYRKRQGVGRPNRIYVKFPSTTIVERKSSTIQKENITQDRKKIYHETEDKLSTKDKENFPSSSNKPLLPSEIKLSTSNNNINNNNTNKINEQYNAYGSYKNVFLTLNEYTLLKKEIKECDKYIENLSRYIASTGKKYTCHAATIRNWAMRDTPKKRTYECSEEESL